MRLEQEESERTELEETGKRDHAKKQEEIGIVSDIDKGNESKYHTNTIDLLKNRKLEFENQSEKMKKSSPRVLVCDNGQSFELDHQVAILDRDNPGIFHGIVGAILQQIGVLDRDNPKVKDTDPLNRMGNVLPLIGPRKNTGNRVSVPNQFTGPVPLTSDLEPDRSDSFTIPTHTGKFFIFYGKFISVYSHLLTLFTTNLSHKYFAFNRKLFLIVSILYQFVSLKI